MFTSQAKPRHIVLMYYLDLNLVDLFVWQCNWNAFLTKVTSVSATKNS